MRIVAGTRRGTPLKSLPGNDTRPTSDKIKESVFNMIGPYFDGGIVVELFGGSGGLSLEALSRGADQAIVFEKNAKACAIIRLNAEKSRFSEQLHIEQNDARNAVKVLSKRDQKVDLLFVDPPYAELNFYELIERICEAGLLTEQAIIICEHDKKIVLPDAYDQFQKNKYTVYGNSAISIYKK